MKKIFLLSLASFFAASASASLCPDVGSRFYAGVGAGVITNTMKNTADYVNPGTYVMVPGLAGAMTANNKNILSLMGYSGFIVGGSLQDFATTAPGFSTPSQSYGGPQGAFKFELGYDFIMPCSGILFGVYGEGGFSNAKNRSVMGLEVDTTLAVDAANAYIPTEEVVRPIYLNLSSKGFFSFGGRIGFTFGDCKRFLAYVKGGVVSRSISGKATVRQTWAGPEQVNYDSVGGIGANSLDNLDLIQKTSRASGWTVGFRWGLGFEAKVTNAFALGIEFSQDIMRGKKLVLKGLPNAAGYEMYCSNKVSMTANTFLVTAKYYFK